MSWKKFKNVKVSKSSVTLIKRRYSVTSDILSFQLCARQYGQFAVRGYAPAHAVQVFFGTIIHQVLDRAHAHFKGLFDSTTTGKIPTNNDIDKYYNQIEAGLKARGIRALNKDMSDIASELIKRFNKIEGPNLYPRVRDTEHRIQSDQGNYILHGVVDVLVDPTIGDPLPSQMEIWDYKATKFPGNDLKRRERFEFQMLVYAELYRIKNGSYPAKAILYFVNELAGDPQPTVRPANALYEVELDKVRIKEALKSFKLTVKDIEKCTLDNVWLPPLRRSTPGKETCDICDIRWSCPSVKYEMRYP
jgi:putative RecB family exonuclease